MSDLDQLTDMGFERERAELALKHGGGMQGALDYLEKNADTPLSELQAASTSSTTQTASPSDQAHANSLLCNACQKRFRTHDQAQFHATKTGHDDFSESADEIAPLTKEERDAKLEEARQRMAAKRAEMSEQEKKDQKRNEQIRAKSTKEQQEAKEALEQKERVKEAQAKKREKAQEVEAKRRVQEKIRVDREERKRKAEVEKAKREGQTFPAGAVEESLPKGTPVPRPAAAAAKPASEYGEARLRLQTEQGTVQRNFKADTTLFEVAHAVGEEKGVEISTFQSTFPKKTWDRTDFGLTLREAGLVPSAALIVR